MTGTTRKSAREQFNSTVHTVAKALPATHDDMGPAMDAPVSLAEWPGAVDGARRDARLKENAQP